MEIDERRQNGRYLERMGHHENTVRPEYRRIIEEASHNTRIIDDEPLTAPVEELESFEVAPRFPQVVVGRQKSTTSFERNAKKFP